ncbi:inner membrane complex protein 24 [Cystoisospora suis]|uniref:Inner membrane complex protein 24 n=1 Tax=Cystoisospora suis TaxID=483139 RepID=A0A2C6LA12_9APIC|nr:inner membrane complex protein 24 [Cystoisospora suis]
MEQINAAISPAVGEPPVGNLSRDQPEVQQHRPMVVPSVSFHESASRSQEAATRDEGRLRSFLRAASTMLSLPSGFFEAESTRRTWGEPNLTDPSVQPARQPRSVFPSHQPLPGYNKSAYNALQQQLTGRAVPFLSLAPRGGFVYKPSCANMDFPRVEIQYPVVGPADLPTYDWTTLPDYKMKDLPYANSLMAAADPIQTAVTGNYLVAYPYGVPAVEENEGSLYSAAKKALQRSDRCKFLC